MKIRSKNMGIFINGSILYHRFISALDVDELLKAVVQKINLEIKRPPWHVLIEIVQVRIILYVFIMRFPIEALSQFFGEGCFPRTNIPCNCYMSQFHIIQ